MGVSTPTVDELSQVKRDLEAALKDVLQAVKVSQEGAPPGAGTAASSLEALASVSTCVLQCQPVFSTPSDCVFCVTPDRHDCSRPGVVMHRARWALN